ncbi:MAG: ABC transporter ATP-binding protein [Vicingaceae bacterium]
MNDQILFHCEKISTGYTNKVILADVDLFLEKGKIYCVFGRNGSGKTTLLKTLSGLIPRLKGKISYDSGNIEDLSQRALAKKRSIVLTERPVHSTMTVWDFVSFGRYPYLNWIGKLKSEDAIRISEALHICGLKEMEQQFMEHLSDGELQKVSIARALAQDTALLFLDEPAAHLDLVNKSEIFYLLKLVSSQKNKTVVFTSHDIQFALQLSDYFCVLNDGRSKVWTSEEFKRDAVYKEILHSDHLEIGQGGESIRFY